MPRRSAVKHTGRLRRAIGAMPASCVRDSGAGSIVRLSMCRPPPVAQVRETLSRRRPFVRLQTTEINAAKRLLRAVGVGYLSRNLRTETGWAKLLATLTPQRELQNYIEQHHA